jgi:hypothetical protein
MVDELGEIALTIARTNPVRDRCNMHGRLETEASTGDTPRFAPPRGVREAMELPHASKAV